MVSRRNAPLLEAGLVGRRIGPVPRIDVRPRGDLPGFIGRAAETNSEHWACAARAVRIQAAPCA